MPEFSKTEKDIIATLNKNSKFSYQDIEYTIIKFDKPTTPKGEPKTDIYILVKDSNNNHLEFKISVKQSNADFLENKMKAERALDIFGINWKEDIKILTKSVSNDFINQKLIYKVKDGKTEEGVFTLGWKFEILNKSASKRSGKLHHKLLREVMSGENLPEDKKNACIKGEIVKDSGISNFILEKADTIDLTNINLIMNNLISIDDYINLPTSQIYFACKALNYRTKYIKSNSTNFSHKWDGDRPLSVYIDWNIVNNKLSHNVCFDDPLIKKGNEVAKKLKDCLSTLNITTTDNINSNNLIDYSIVKE